MSKIAKTKIASLVILLIASFLVTTFPITYAAPHTDITVATAWNMMTNGTYPNLMILDVRNQSEYDTGYIQKAVLIPLWQLQQRIGELAAYKNTEILVYCRTGGRSHNASVILDAGNFTKVYDMNGGLTAWNSSGYPIATPVSPVFSIMQITDLQHLAFLSPTLYNDTTSWIVNNSVGYNLKMVVYTGDFVDAFVTNPPPPPLVIYNASQIAQEWAVANGAMSKLLNAGIPYCWDAGNHDQTPFGNSSGTMTGSSYPAFNATAMRSKPYWVSDIYGSKNTAVKFTYNNYPFLIINLEFMANSSALDWMKSLLVKNTGVNVIIATHGYLNANAEYSSSSSATVAWNNALKATLDSYPNVFLALSGHIHGVNMTRVGNRQEILFDRQEANNGTGAASVRIYTFNLTNKKVNASTYCLDTKTWLTDAYNQFSFDTSLTSDWTLVNDARPMKAYPDLREYVWQKDARMQPNGIYDKIGLHRLVKTGITPKGVVFLTNCPMWSGEGEQRISNPPSDSWTKYENYSQAIYWANRGFDVYAIDYRTSFVPKTLNASQMPFTKDWGLDVWVSDIKEAAEKVKEVSGSKKFFISGECTGGQAALNYATKYWKNDLRGIILLDANFPPIASYPIIGRINETNTYNMTKAINDMNAMGNWTSDAFRTFRPIALYALQNPGGAAVNPTTNQSLTPLINPLTNKTWTNITEWFTYVAHNMGGAGMYCNLMGGYANISQVEYNFANSGFMPYRLFAETAAMADWVNCPYLTYDYNDHYNEIGVPVLAFAASLFSNRTGTFRFVNGINNTDFTGVMLKNYGHVDVYYGTYSARDVSEPAYQWMATRYPALTASVSPASVTINAGQSATFTVNASGTVPPYTYQWYLGNTLLVGQNKTQLSITTTTSTAGDASYYCKVTDAEGITSNSSTVSLKVIAAPAETQPTTETPSTTPTPTTEQWSVTITSSAGGTTAPNGTVNVDVGNGLTVTATPNTGYNFSKWMFDGTDFDNSTQVTIPSQNSTTTHTLHAVFIESQQTLPAETGQAFVLPTEVYAAVIVIVIVLAVAVALVLRKRAK